MTNRFQLEIDRLSLRLGSDFVIHPLSLQLQRQHIGCLLGGSGSGKTTLLRALSGLQSIESGKIKVAGHLVADGAQISLEAAEREIGLVFQDYALFPHLNVRSNLTVGVRHLERQKQKQRVESIAEILQIQNFLERRPFELSGGQQQRVAIGRALATYPQVLLMDEPFANIDAGMRAGIKSELRSIFEQQKMTVLFVTHSIEDAYDLADVVGVMEHGKLLDWGSIEDLLYGAKHLACAQVLGPTVALPGDLADNDCFECELGKIPLFCASLSRPRLVTLLDGKSHIILRPYDLRIAEQGLGVRVLRQQRYSWGYHLEVQSPAGTRFYLSSLRSHSLDSNIFVSLA